MMLLFQLPKQVYVANSRTSGGAKLYFYLSGTTTEAAVYTDSALTTAHSQPVTAASSGVFAPIYLDPAVSYKVQLKTSSGSLIYEVDPISVPLTADEVGAALHPLTTAETSAGLTTADLNLEYAPGNVLRYGTNSTPGTTNMTAALQSAIDAAEAGHGFVYVPAGTYSVNTTLTVNSGHVTVYGDGPASVLKMASSANLNRILYFNGASSATCHSLKFDGNRAGQTTAAFGALLESFNTPQTMFYGVHAVDSYTDGISIRNGGQGYIDGCYIDNCKLTGSKITTTDYVRVVNNTYKDCQTSVNVIDGGHECMVSNNTIIGDGGTISTNGIIFTAEYTDEDPGERGVIEGNVITGCGSASTGGGINVVSDQATRSEARVVINGNSVNECRDGIVATNVSGLSIVGNVITKSDLRGISLSGVSDVSVFGNVLNEHDNSASAPYAISVATNASSGDSTRVSIIGNTITNSTTDNSPVGIYVPDSSQTSIVVLGNQFSGCTTEVSIPAGAAPLIRNNAGYVTEAKGTATIASGATTAVVTHGLDYTPSAGEITLTVAEQGSNDYGRVWVSSIGATQFTINVASDPGASNLDVGWSVRKV